MGILDRIFKEMFEDKAGRIHAISAGWDFNPSKSLIKRTIERNPNFYRGKPYIRKDADEKEMTLIRRRTVSCPNPEVERGKFPRSQNKDGPSRWYIPYSICRKCEYHRKSEHKYRFPRCLFRASINPIQAAIEETQGILSKAVDEAKKIMG